jgi:acetyl/propionyl-CoA carboxylase alpha subunit
LELIERIPKLTRLVFGDKSLEVTSSGTIYSASLEGLVHRLEVLQAEGGRLELLLDGRRLVAYFSAEGQDRWVTVAGRTFLIRKTSRLSRSSASHDGSSDLSAPMPGQVRAVNVQAGDAVTKGQVLMILEAMKMEIRLHAPFDGKVSTVEASVGQTVEREQVLVHLQRH